MKDFLIALIIVSGLALSATAQSYGIKGGYSLSNLATSDGDIEKDNARHGFSAGLVANYPIGIFSIQPEVLFTQKGSEYKYLAVDVKSNMDYIELPVSLQLNLFDPFYIYVGPQVSYLVNSNVEYSIGNSEVSFDRDESNSERLDVGAVAGLGFKFNKMFIDARFSRGYVDFDRERTIDGAVFEAKNLQNFNFQLTTGIMF